MTSAPPQEGIDYLALSERLIAAKRSACRNPVINELLYDVRKWAKLAPAELSERLKANPLALLAAWELTDAASYLNQEGPEEIELLRALSQELPARNLVYLGIDGLPEQLPEVHRTVLMQRRTAWDGLGFLHQVLRWAARFCSVAPYDRRSFTRMNLQCGFASAVLGAPQSEVDSVVHDVLHALGIRIAQATALTEGVALEKFLLDSLGIKGLRKAARQQVFDFREAGHTQNSIFVVRAIGGVDGCDVRGTTGEDLGLIIDIGDREVSKAATAYLERYVVRIINDRTPLSAELRGNALRLRWYDTSLEAEQIGDMIYRALKDRLIMRIVSVNLIFDPLRISSLRPSILSYREEREQELARRQETNAPFIVCRENRHYAPHGFVIASVDRPPPDGRSYDELAVQAQFTRGVSQLTIDPGICQDRVKGRYIGVDKYAQLFSEGNVETVCLHSLREHPHPTLGNPQCIAYYMDEFDVICILSRDYSGRAPDGKTFETLLTRIAGRQVPGYSGISESYILSSKFFAAEGGLSSVAWMNSSLKQRLGIREEAIATEAECINIAGLSEYMSRWRH